MGSNKNYNRLQASEALIDDLTVNNLTINNKSGSINYNDITIISKSKKVECTLEEIVDNNHVIIKETDGELLYCGCVDIPDTTYLFKTFNGDLYYRFDLNTCVKSNNGRYSFINMLKKNQFNLVYDWFQETYLIVHSTLDDFLYGFENRYDLELLPYYCIFDTTITEYSINKTKIEIIGKISDEHYTAKINEKNLICVKLNNNIIKDNNYFGKTINVSLIRKALIFNLSMYHKSFAYDNKNYNTIIPLYHIKNNMSLFTEKLTNRTIVAKRLNYLCLPYNLQTRPDFISINAIMFDVYFCAETIIKSNNGNFIMIYSFKNSNKYVFYDKHKNSFIIVHLTYDISNIQQDRDKIGYSFIINKLYRLHYADSHSLNDGKYILNSINEKFVTVKNNNNSIIAIRNIFDLTNSLYGKTLNFTFIPYFEYIYKH